MQHGGAEHADADHGGAERDAHHGDTKVSHSAPHAKGAARSLGLHAGVMRCGQRGMARCDAAVDCQRTMKRCDVVRCDNKGVN